MAIRMQPVRSVFARMPRLARDVAGKLGKQVRLSMSGEQSTRLVSSTAPLTSIHFYALIPHRLVFQNRQPFTRLRLPTPTKCKVWSSAVKRGTMAIPPRVQL